MSPSIRPGQPRSSSCVGRSEHAQPHRGSVVDDHVGDVRPSAAQPLLDLACPRVRVRQRRGRIEPERHQGDDSLFRPQEPQRARRAAGRARDGGLELRRLDDLACTDLGERLEMRLHRGDLGDGAEDRALDLLRELVRLLERKVARELAMERELGGAAERDDAEVVDLPHPWHGQRRGVGALAQRRLVRVRLDVDDDVAAGQHPLELGLDPVGDGMTLADGCPRRHGDDHVRERPPACLPQPQPRQLDRRLDPRDRRSRRLLGVRRSVVHQHVHVAADQPRRRHEHEGRDEERGDRVTLREPGRRRHEAGENRECAGEVAGEVERVRAQRLAPVAPGRPQRDDGSPEVDRQHEPDDREDPPSRIDDALRRPSEACQRESGDRNADESEHRRLEERCEMLGLSVPVLMLDVRRPAGDADREEGQQRGDEVGARVQRLGDEPEAAAREARAELQRDECSRRADRNERRAALRGHAPKVRRRVSTSYRGGSRRTPDR